SLPGGEAAACSWPLSAPVSFRFRQIPERARPGSLSASPECGFRSPELSGPIGRTPASRCTRCDYGAGVARGYGGLERLRVRGRGAALVRRDSVLEPG